MARIPYANRYDADVRKAPKAKLPYIVIDGNKTIADSELILRYLKESGKFTVDDWLTDTQVAQSVAITRLIEDHLYWLMVDSRWLNDEVWLMLKNKFFAGLPPVLNVIIPSIVRKQVRKTLYAQGLGRHNRDELSYFAKTDLAALAGLLGDRNYMMGDRLCSADATVYGILSCIYYPDFNTPLKSIALGHSNLLTYCERITGEYFPEYRHAKS